MTQPTPAQCRRRHPHTPHGTCLGLAPEWPSERVEVVDEERYREILAGYADRADAAVRRAGGEKED